MNYPDWEYFINSELLGLENLSEIQGEKKSWIKITWEKAKSELQKRINQNQRNKTKFPKILEELIESEEKMEKISYENYMEFLERLRKNNISPKKLGEYFCNEFQIVDFSLSKCENPNVAVKKITNLYLDYSM